MYQRLNKNSAYQNFTIDVCDPKDPYLPSHYGTFEINVDVQGKKRRMLAYAPAEIRDSTAAVIILGENGKTADDLLKKSGWCEIADTEECKEKLIVFFLEPENGKWQIDEPYGKTDGDVAYVNAAALAATERYLFCVHESKIYLTGCREGGVMANMAAAWNPAFYAGVVSVGGSSVSPEYLEAAGKDFCANLDGFTDESHRQDIRKGSIPMPAWVIDDPESPVGAGDEILQYWRTACGTDDRPRQLSKDQVEYTRSAETPYPLNQEKGAYRVCYSNIPGSSAGYAKPLLRRIWKDFLYRQRRWMSCPGGDLRVTQDPVRDLNMEYHYEEVDGWMREWYIYIPEAVKNNPGRKVPVVFAIHGYTCSGEIYSGNSEWYRVAEQYGFIAVFPSALHAHVNMPDQGLLPEFTPLAAWNIFNEEDCPDEMRFFHYMLDQLLEKYPADPGRVFATGHSWGSLMTQKLGLEMTDRLAAIAPCSGVFFGGASERMRPFYESGKDLDTELPIWMFWGMEEEWLIPGNPAHENETGFTIEMWLKRNHKEEMIPKDWDSCPGVINGRFTDHSFEKEGTAPVRYTQVDYMPHATMPEMSFRIWEEFFSGLRRELQKYSLISPAGEKKAAL